MLKSHNFQICYGIKQFYADKSYSEWGRYYDFFNVDFLTILDWCKRMYVIKLIDVPALGMHCLNAVVWLQEMFGQIFPKMIR